jgi:hypothetical protein
MKRHSGRQFKGVNETYESDGTLTRFVWESDADYDKRVSGKAWADGHFDPASIWAPLLFLAMILVGALIVAAR